MQAPNVLVLQESSQLPCVKYFIEGVNLKIKAINIETPVMSYDKGPLEPPEMKIDELRKVIDKYPQSNTIISMLGVLPKEITKGKLHEKTIIVFGYSDKDELRLLIENKTVTAAILLNLDDNLKMNIARKNKLTDRDYFDYNFKFVTAENIYEISPVLSFTSAGDKKLSLPNLDTKGAKDSAPAPGKGEMKSNDLNHE